MKNKVIDVVELKKQVKDNLLKFYVEKKYIYCENIYTKERVIVGENNIILGVDLGSAPDKQFESLATINYGSVSRPRGL